MNVKARLVGPERFKVNILKSARIPGINQSKRLAGNDNVVFCNFSKGYSPGSNPDKTLTRKARQAD